MPCLKGRNQRRKGQEAPYFFRANDSQRLYGK
jgi:hypothetical protein